MGDSRKAIAEDEDEWDRLKKAAKLTDVNWDVYSKESTLTRKGFNLGMRGRRLKLYVKHQLEHDQLVSKHKKEVDELGVLEELEHKYS